MSGFTFGQILEYLKEGTEPCRRAFRANWNGTRLDGDLSMYIEYVPETGGVLEHLLLTTPQGTQAPWLATSTDMFADDWCLVTSGTSQETAAARADRLANDMDMTGC